ncbi:MAG: ribulose-phosphate 3-epimerase [Acholeplasmataceae bacterium]
MKIAPSILTADFTNLADEIKSVSSADYLHIDIMDGHFVPNISFGPAITKAISKIAKIDLDVHLMVKDPLFWIDRFAFDNTTYITVHVESERVHEAIKAIKDKNIKAGISLKPNTPVAFVSPLLGEIDLVLVMTVEPGFGGQLFMSDMLDKVKELVKLREKYNLNFVIEVDGGINEKTALLCKEVGVDIVVAGSFLFKLENRKEGIEKLR